MSTYLYLQCRNHQPYLRSQSESGQHLTDLPQIQRDIADRESLAKRFNDSHVDDRPSEYFRNHTYNFLGLHQQCKLGIVTEYGTQLPLDGEPCYAWSAEHRANCSLRKGHGGTHLSYSEGIVPFYEWSQA